VIFLPSGVVGRLYWLLMRPLHTAALRGLARQIVESAS
jgi:hypothetical protein